MEGGEAADYDEEQFAEFLPDDEGLPLPLPHSARRDGRPSAASKAKRKQQRTLSAPFPSFLLPCEEEWRAFYSFVFGHSSGGAGGGVAVHERGQPDPRAARRPAQGRGKELATQDRQRAAGRHYFFVAPPQHERGADAASEPTAAAPPQDSSCPLGQR